MMRTEDPILDILNAVAKNEVKVDEAHSYIIKIINNIQLNSNPNTFKFDEYVLFEKNE